MKILLINNRFGREAVGGAEKIVLTLTQSLQKIGHEVFVLSLSARRHELELNGIKVIYLKSKFISLSHWSKLARLLYHIWEFRPSGFSEAKNIIDRIKPDLIWSHNLLGFGWGFAKLFKNYKWAHSLHDTQLLHPSGQIAVRAQKLSLSQKIYQCWLRRILGRPNLIISPSRWLIWYHQEHQLFENIPVLTLPSPLAISVLPRVVERKKYWLWAGQLYAGKGIKWLIRLWRLDRTLPSLYIAGQGQLAGWLKQEIRKDQRLKYLGGLTSEEIAGHLEQAQGLVFTSLILENWPGIIAEAIYFGCPVVGPKAGGVPEMIKNGVNGYLYEVGAIADFKKGIKAAANLTVNPASRLQTPSAEHYVRQVLGNLEI